MKGEPVVRVLRRDPSLPLPRYESEGAAGMDLRACLEEDIVIPPLGRALVPTGLSLEIPEGCEAQVRPRSGLAASQGVTVLNSPGTIDSDYRGEVKVVMINLGAGAFTVKSGDRIAQLVFSPVLRAVLEPVSRLTETSRGSGGFGSTGK
ncbi:MAG: dUTP diphosphatase [Treponema sp.]|jgi:dUTP pyrophosphatase|nr:dUTP diphosphatase [Treponema sp.]